MKAVGERRWVRLSDCSECMDVSVVDAIIIRQTIIYFSLSLLTMYTYDWMADLIKKMMRFNKETAFLT
jgi:hypothetical protein